VAITVRLPAALRPYAEGARQVTVEGSTVGEALAALERGWPLVGRRVLDEQGCIRRHVLVYVGDERVGALDEALPAGVDMTILPAASGG
jgi:molybdopterin converting factor small subunit